MVGEAMRQVSLGSSILPFLRPLSPTQVGPCPPPTLFSSGLHVLSLHLNTHSPTIRLGLSEDQWGSQGLAQQGAGGKSLTRAKKGTPEFGDAVGRSPAGNRDVSLGLASCWGKPLEGLIPQWGDLSTPLSRGPGQASKSVLPSNFGDLALHHSGPQFPYL